MSYSIFRWIHIILTGIMTVPFTLFLATGFISENYDDELFLAPEFLILIAIWLIGAILMFFSKTKVIGMVLTTLPSVFYVAIIVYFLLIPALTY
ncbi:hypothetical protein [Jeotgalibacillus terrae]|uniref:Uncharacterized protein n=1 Tax=Jeotgalibacillus terrae TaxID=587735 RepID=A0ABW5ZJK9_9BACL|nr:hypothetical protein [Jeotgalibacillus terrae]MBM7579377.1 putative phage infection (PIP) family protein YhgE [Jeotgalibacillus terrae]